VLFIFVMSSHVYYCFKNEKRDPLAVLPVVTFDGPAISVNQLKVLLSHRCLSPNDKNTDLTLFEFGSNRRLDDEKEEIRRNTTVYVARVPKATPRELRDQSLRKPLLAHGIPKTFLKKTVAANQPGAFALTDGTTVAVMNTHHVAAIAASNTDDLSPPPPPQELICPMCHLLMSYAVHLKCCPRFKYCDRCIRDAIEDQEEDTPYQCKGCHSAILHSSILPDYHMRQDIDAFLEGKYPTTTTTATHHHRKMQMRSCYGCGAYDHIRRHCPFSSSSSSSTSSSSSSFRHRQQRIRP
jgi:hypothetical protein